MWQTGSNCQYNCLSRKGQLTASARPTCNLLGTASRAQGWPGCLGPGASAPGLSTSVLCGHGALHEQLVSPAQALAACAGCHHGLRLAAAAAGADLSCIRGQSHTCARTLGRLASVTLVRQRRRQQAAGPASVRRAPARALAAALALEQSCPPPASCALSVRYASRGRPIAMAGSLYAAACWACDAKQGTAGFGTPRSLTS